MANKRARTRLVVSAAGGFTSLGLIAVVFIGGHEGESLTTYRDVVGIPTNCFGETRGARMGQTFTDAQCKALLVSDLVGIYEPGMRGCVKDADRIPDESYAAFLSVTYNIGVSAFCGSSMAKRLNAGDLPGACDALLMWNKAGGRVIVGLDRRRHDERALCLKGVADGKLTPPVTVAAP